MDKKKPEIKFPRLWEFRLIAVAETMEQTKAAVAALGSARSTVFDTAPGESSGSGKYAALRVSCQVASMDEAREIAGALGKLDGVRFLI